MSYETHPPPSSVNDSGPGYINSSCMDFLLIELVPMAYRMAAELAAREDEYVTPGNPGATTGRRASAVAATNGAGSTPKSGTTPRIAEGGVVGSADEEELKDAVLYRLEMLGYRVGLGITERYVYSAVLQGVPLGVGAAGGGRRRYRGGGLLWQEDETGFQSTVPDNPTLGESYLASSRPLALLAMQTPRLPDHPSLSGPSVLSAYTRLTC